MQEVFKFERIKVFTNDATIIMDKSGKVTNVSSYKIVVVPLKKTEDSAPEPVISEKEYIDFYHALSRKFTGKLAFNKIVCVVMYLMAKNLYEQDVDFIHDCDTPGIRFENTGSSDHQKMVIQYNINTFA